MFRGITAVNLDAKGRMALPVRHREQLQKHAEPLIVTIDTEERCLLLYPLVEWEIIEQKLQALPSFNPTARRIQRLLIGHATELELDSQCRILLPPLLRDYAGLNKRVMLVGQGKKFEIWGEEHWQTGRTAWLAEGIEKDGEMPPELQTLSL